MHLDEVFRWSSTTVLLAWSALVLLPRSAWLRRASFALVGALCAAYSVLAAVFLFPSGGDFASLDGLQRLFASRPVLLAGWLHYLAFDLCVGWWIAARLDARGVSRWLQVPILLATFMVGPVGLLLAGAVLLATRPAGVPSLPASVS